jgi:hypothetical protein
LIPPAGFEPALQPNADGDSGRDDFGGSTLPDALQEKLRQVSESAERAHVYCPSCAPIRARAPKARRSR